MAGWGAGKVLLNILLSGLLPDKSLLTGVSRVLVGAGRGIPGLFIRRVRNKRNLETLTTND
jgi:hypothetical protein